MSVYSRSLVKKKVPPDLELALNTWQSSNELIDDR
jgi:hypothetical protein